MIDPAEIAELRELEAKATPGPLPEPLPNRAVVLPTRALVVRFQLCSDADAALFVAARNALPKLLDDAERCARLEALLREALPVLVQQRESLDLEFRVREQPPTELETKIAKELETTPIAAAASAALRPR